MCGEKLLLDVAAAVREGSPPRVRGKDAFAVWTEGRRGITTACAGKSVNKLFAPLARWDHPRVCGEKSQKSRSFLPLPGSPPRVRGKDTDFGQEVYVMRITPACAGKSALAF